MEQQSIQFKRKRKFLLMLPILLLAVFAALFYAMGGGSKGGQAAIPHGINASLPGAQFDKNDKQQDKLSLYEKRKRDSISAKEHDGSAIIAAMGFDTAAHKDNNLNPHTPEAGVVKINQKLAEINKQLNAPQPKQNYPGNYALVNPPSPDIERLEKLLKQKQQSNAPDPEMQQLNAMLEKIQDIQHPERMTAQLKQQERAKPDSIYKAFRAVITDNQKVMQGSSVKLRLVDSLIIKDQVIPKGAFVFGYVQITNQRLLLNIKNIRLGTSILPVDLTVYDMDGMEGIQAPYAITQDALRSGSDNAIQSLQFLPMDQSLTTQAAGAGIEAAKGLFSKKVKRIKIKLKKNYPVLLRNNKPDKHS